MINMMKKMTSNESVGGVGNTPLTDTYIDKEKLEKSVLIDWLSVSLDFINLEQVTSREFQIDYYDPNLIQLLSYFGITSSQVHNLEKSKGLNGFSHSMNIGENIKLLYGLGQLNKNNRHPLNLLLSGQACREFERNMQGNWKDLLSFLLSHNSTIKRLDIAIDDFNGDEITIYEIEPFIKRFHYVSPLHNTQIITSSGIENGLRILTGYSITLGSPGSNQLQIYDKNLERKHKGILTSVSNWFRYEMRMVDDKATNLARLYITSVEENNSYEFMLMAKSLLFQMLDLKVPKIKGKKTNDTNISRWDTYSKWLSFLDSVEKIKLDSKKPDEISMIRKKKYFERSYSAFIAEQEMFQDSYAFQKWLAENKRDGLVKIANESKRLSAINNGRELQGKKKLSKKELLERINEINEELTYYENED